MSANISVIGLGFVGLTTALGFSCHGFRVTGYDIDKKRQDNLSEGIVPFLEPELPQVLDKCLNKSFFITDSIQTAVLSGDVIFVCVSTPTDDTGKADLQYVYSVLDNIKSAVDDDCKKVIVIKSTIPPGTILNNIIPYMKEYKNLIIANNPEFLREGRCWHDFMNPDRIICGTEDLNAVNLLREIYKPFNAPFYIVSPNTAEFVKYLSNSLLASLISYSNEMALVAEAIGGIDVKDAFRILHTDSRLKDAGITEYIYPGCGYGGACLPKDTSALSSHAVAHGFTPKILNEVTALNDKMPETIAEKIMKISDGENIGILGLSFKPGSDDVRCSPAAKIINAIIKMGAKSIYVYDPVANLQFKESYHFPMITYCDTMNEVCDKCKTVAIVTTWSIFTGLDKKYEHINWIDCRYFL